MRNPWIWSVSLGRWWNVHVRLHMFFFIFAAFAVYATRSPSFHEPWLGGACVIAVFFSVLLHEIGHVVVARRLGGIGDEIVLSPVGGLSPIRVPYEPQSELVALMGGTLVNAMICFATALTLALAHPEFTDLVGLLKPNFSYLSPDEPKNAVTILKLVFWVNWSLILLNLIPCFPFDGGRSLHAVSAFLWPEVSSSQVHGSICRLGKVISVVMLILACHYFWSNNITETQPPVWFALSVLSMYIFFNSRREEMHQAAVDREDDTVFGYDFSQGYTSLERSLVDDEEPTPRPPQPGILKRWLEKRRESQRERELAQEVEDERRVDEVLGRLHVHGMHNLSQDDRSLLDRVSKRYRSRQSQ